MNPKAKPANDALTEWLRKTNKYHLVPYSRMNNGAKNRAQAAVTLSKRFDGMNTQYDVAIGSYQGSTGQYTAKLLLKDGSIETECNCTDHGRNRGMTCKHVLATAIHWAGKLKHPKINEIVSKWGGADTSAANKAKAEKAKAEQARLKAEKKRKEEAARQKALEEKRKKEEAAAKEKALKEQEKQQQKKEEELKKKQQEESKGKKRVKSFADIHAIALAASKIEKTKQIKWFIRPGSLQKRDLYQTKYKGTPGWDVDIGRGPRKDELDAKEWRKVKNAANRAVKSAIERLGYIGVVAGLYDEKGWITISFTQTSFKEATMKTARSIEHVFITNHRREAQKMADMMVNKYKERVYIYQQGNGFLVILDSKVDTYPIPLLDRDIIELVE